jgi:FAD/FMN-containing dehydrogenase
VEHAAGDLIVVVRAGTPLADLSTKLAAACQQLALDAPLPGATVGGTVAVNTSGPRRMAYGTVRDLLIGVTIVRPDGVLARAGGKVVKNVAGYDLGKLVTGSYGTLGLITECAFRLHPVPEAGVVLRRPVDGPAGLRTLVSAVLGAQVVPAALELDAPAGGGLELASCSPAYPRGCGGGWRRRARCSAARSTRRPGRRAWLGRHRRAVRRDARRGRPGGGGRGGRRPAAGRGRGEWARGGADRSGRRARRPRPVGAGSGAGADAQRQVSVRSRAALRARPIRGRAMTADVLSSAEAAT